MHGIFRYPFEMSLQIFRNLKHFTTMTAIFCRHRRPKQNLRSFLNKQPLLIGWKRNPRSSLGGSVNINFIDWQFFSNLKVKGALQQFFLRKSGSFYIRTSHGRHASISFILHHLFTIWSNFVFWFPSDSSYHSNGDAKPFINLVRRFATKLSGSGHST